LKLPTPDRPEIQISAAEFILEGLHAHKRIGRSEERVFTAGEKAPKRGSEREIRREEVEDEFDFRRKNRRPFN
jgi:magnesium chelatase subunit I